jgi:electron transport complex protein RnfC
MPGGLDAKHVVPAGVRVVAGQPLLADIANAAGVPLAPAAGVVAGVTSVRLLGNSGPTAAVEIEIDPGSVRAPQESGSPPPSPTDLPSLIERLRTCGVRAARTCSPDLLAQLDAARSNKVDTILCSLLDPAGGSALSAVVLRTLGKEMLAGVDAIARATGAVRVWLVADTNIINRATALVRRSASSANDTGNPTPPATPSRLTVVELENDYPQADPTLLLYALLGRKLPPGRLPSDANVILLDGAAAAAVGRAATRNEPMLDVPIEVRDSARSRSTVYTAAVGLPVRFLLDAAGLRTSELTLRAGAALRDMRVSCDAVVDGGGEPSIDAGPLSSPINPDPCIRCGWCVEACPVRIHPAAILEAAQDADPAMAADAGLHACIECGICSYVCPSR